MTDWQHVSHPSGARQQLFSAYQQGHLIPNTNTYHAARSQFRGLRHNVLELNEF
jgi:hypothetical protein